MPKQFILMILALFLGELCAAQSRCSSNEYNLQLQERHSDISHKVQELEEAIVLQKSELKLAGISSQIIRIPVVVHVIHNDALNPPGTSGSTNISDEQILSQIEVLNEDFRRMANTNGYNEHPVGTDVEVEFCLAAVDPSGNPTNGIVRVYNSKSSWQMPEDAQLKALSYWPSNRYLNIWVTNMASTVLGYAQFPHGSVYADLEDEVPVAAETDGVVIDYEAFGRLGTARAPYNLGRTATHEIGHWLGLRHMWDIHVDGCGDDAVDDTPLDDKSNNDADCVDSSFCQGAWIQDMARNYMDYSIDICFNFFTEGQKERIMGVMNSAPRRVELMSSEACGPTLSVGKEFLLNITLVPNPAVNTIKIQARSEFTGICRIINSAGEEVRTLEVRNNEAVNIETLPPGIYLFHIRFREGTVIRKLIKL